MSDPLAKNGKRSPEAHCDYCNAALDCAGDSVRAREYWRHGFLGILVCNACLPNISDDFPQLSGDDRLLALRLHWARGIDLPLVDSSLEAARGIVVAKQLIRLREERDTFLQLHHEGELVAAVWAAQALWNSTNHLRDAIESRQARAAGQKVINGGKKSGEARRGLPPLPHSKEARIIAEAGKYQGAADAKIATIARKTEATPQYVGKILRKIGNSNS